MNIAEIVSATNGANTANGLAQAAMAEFETHCRAHQWDKAEEARLRVVANMEAYLDNIAAVHKILQRG